ncbi:MAG: hypothetical protein ACLU4N_03190 [Butyricimonas faecihominis]
MKNKYCLTRSRVHLLTANDFKDIEAAVKGKRRLMGLGLMV